MIHDKNKSDIKDGLESIELGLVFGLGYQFGDHFLVDARYNFGVSDAIKDVDAENSVFQLSLGYKF